MIMIELYYQFRERSEKYLEHKKASAPYTQLHIDNINDCNN